MEKKLTKEELRSSPILSLSFVGDAVHTVKVRTKYFSPTHKNNELHVLSSADCCAPRQAEAAKKMETLLNEEELFIFKKGKNAPVHSVPKNASLYEYKLATAFEAVIGYLYLLGQEDRMNELVDKSYEKEGSEKIEWVPQNE